MFQKLFDVGKSKTQSTSDLLMDEKIELTNRFIVGVVGLLFLYLPIYYLTDNFFLFYLVISAIGSYLFAIFLMSTRKTVAARNLFLLTSYSIIFSGDLRFQHAVVLEAYYLPACLAAFLIFNYQERKNIFLMNIIPLSLYLFPRVFNLEGIFQFSTPSQDIVSKLKMFNCVGSFFLTNYFAYIFFSSISSFQQKLISSSSLASLGEMAAGIAHEINNPLAIIAGKISSIKKYAVQESEKTDVQKLKNDLEKVEQTTFRISKIIKGLRSFSRSGELEEFAEFDLASCVDDLVGVCGERVRSRNIDIKVNIPLGVNIFGNQLQIGQVLLNLVNNSVDAISGNETAWIEISYSDSADLHEISVTDSGMGISKKVEAKMMEPFFTTKELGKGTGLGLSISRGILQSHRGSLDYQLHLGHTRFSLHLPKVKKIP